ncbi:MAG: hypothetical protein ACREOE_03010, partial [Gemmatimonadales bacterium]
TGTPQSALAEPDGYSARALGCAAAPTSVPAPREDSGAHVEACSNAAANQCANVVRVASPRQPVEEYMHRRALLALTAAAVLASSGAMVANAAAGTAGANSGITTRIVKGGQKTVLARGVAGNGELAPQSGPESISDHVPVANRSLSSQAKAIRGGGLSGIVASSTPVIAGSPVVSFSGINHFEQRFGVAGGNQWSTEPPDQALCVGGGYVFEAVNNAIAVYSPTGTEISNDSLNHFFWYGYEIYRTAGVAGPKQTTDPSCLYDPTTGRFFLTQLTYDSDGAGNPLPSGTNTIDVAVSSSSSPIGTWTITHIDVTDDGSDNTPLHPGCPCIGDYPHIGVDATGFYVTTNEYPWFTNGFVGAQIYAMSKADLASGATSVRVTQIDTSRQAPGGKAGFTVWPAQSPTAAQYSASAGGTEYFLSTNAAGEVGTGSSTDLITWSLTNTSSLDTTPNLHLHAVTSPVSKYAVPNLMNQKVGSDPLGQCLNITACAKLALGTPDKFKEYEDVVDPLDSRMQQVTYANGLLYGSHGTAVDVGSPLVQHAGVAWYITQPITDGVGNLSTTVLHQGVIANAGNNVAMPAIGVKADGSAVIGLTLVGTDHFPSAAYVTLSSAGATGSIQVLAEGVGPDDGFTGYRGFQTRTRWGDYGAAAVDASGNLWVANEWIAQSCTLAQFLASPLGQCGGTRTLLANWSTRISEVTP